MTTDRLKLLTIKIKFAEELLQYSSQIVETDTASPEFSRKFLRFTPHTFVLTVMCPLPPRVEPRVLWSTETAVIPKSTLGKGKRTQVFHDFWRGL